jgi:NAD(P)-dependent dehydrogenase (short-subunit alcohol dehydrogenase family)
MGGIAEELAREGANLVCADIREDYAEKCASAIAAEGHDAMGVGCDVTDEKQVDAAIAKAAERFGGVDILVNGAALFNFKGVLNMPVDEWRRQTDIILTGAFFVHQACGPFDDPAESKGQHHQHHFHCGTPGRAR